MFFRDPLAFEALRQLAVAPLFEDVPAEEGIRAWVVGCATGEEAYSLAILLLEEAARRQVQVPIQIFATDLDEGALATAREGRYPRSIEADVSRGAAEALLHRRGHALPRAQGRPRCRAVRLAQRPQGPALPPARPDHLPQPADLSGALAAAAALLAVPLRAEAAARCLFLGSAETADSAPELFVPVDRDARLYRSRPRPAHGPARCCRSFRPTRHRSARSRCDSCARGSARRYRRRRAMRRRWSRRRRRASSSTTNHNIVHLSPSAGRFILHSAGPFTSPALARSRGPSCGST